ncbi:hypothetical protein [Erwinia sp. LJJL01]|uniref:hypothetical protein n=1 Tax=Erwinia sp. LJJL01 TaxID=3391839 RepID=UPI001061ED8A
MGFPSLATDYIEDGICLNPIFIPHTSATSLTEFGGRQYAIDCAVAPDGDAKEGYSLSEVIVIGTVVLKITKHHDFNWPVI